MRKVLITALVVLVLVGAGGMAYAVYTKLAGQGSVSYLQEAKKSLAKRDTAKALIHLKNAVQEDPESAEARLMLGLLQFDAGDPRSAEKELRHAARLGISEDRYLPILARALLAQRKFEDVITKILPGKREPEIEAAVHTARGFSFLGTERLEEADRELRRALALKPDLVRAKLGLALLYQQQNNLEAAEKEIDVVLASDEIIVEAHLMKGQLRRAARDHEGAAAAFAKSTEVSPNNARAWLGHAAALISLDRDDEAIADLEKARKLAPRNIVGHYLGAVLLAKEEKYGEAISRLQEIGGGLASYAPALYLISFLNLEENQLEQAESHLRTLTKLIPNEPAPRKLLASLYLRKGTPERAIEILSRMSGEFPSDIQVTSMLANAYLRAGDQQKAATELQKLAALNPEDTAIQTQLALTRVQSGDTGAAIDDLQSILKRSPDAKEASIVLLLTQLRENNPDGALSAGLALKAQMPDSPLPDNLLGAVHARMGKLGQARASFESALRLNPKFIPALLNIAQLDRASGNFDDAKTRYEQIIGIDPGHVGGMLALSRLAMRGNDRERALDWLKKAVSAKPYDVQPRLRLVDYYMAVNDPAVALIEARELFRMEPQNPFAIDALGRALIANGQAASAVSMFRKLVSLFPDAPLARQRLANALDRVNDVKGAIKILEGTIKKNERYAPAYIGLMNLSAREGDLDAAMAYAERYRALRPDAADPEAAIGDLHMRFGKPAAAAEAYGKALQKQPESKYVIGIYRAHLSDGKRDQALKTLRDWLRDKPNDDRIRFALASDLLSNGDLKESEVQHNILLEQNQDNPVVLNNVAWLYDQRGDKKAVEFAERAHEAAKNSAAIKDTLGWLLVRHGDAQRGADLLREAAKRLKNNLEVQYHYAVALERTGEADVAREVLESILSAGREFKGADDARTLLAKLKRG